MNFLTVAMVITGVVSSAFAQLVLKAGTNALGSLPEANSLIGAVLRIFSQPFILAGIGLYGLSMFVWLGVLSRMPVSVAYPLLSVGYIITAVFGFILFSEPITWQKILGIFVIISGVMLITSN